MGDSNLSDVLRRLGRPAEARDGYARAIAIREALVGEHPKVPLYRTNLAWSLRRRGLTLGDLGDPAAAAASEAETAMALLHWGLETGYREAAAYRTGEALGPLRDRPDFGS